MLMKSLYPLAIAVACLSCSSFVASSEGSVFVGFETSEGFTPNSRSNTAGWSFSNDNRIRVSNGTTEPAHTGQYSIYTLGGSTITAQNTSLASASEHLNTFTVSIASPTTSWANNANTSWVYIFLWDETLQANRAVQFLTRYGTTSSSNYIIGYSRDSGLNDDKVATYYSNTAQSNLVLTDWNTFSTVFDFENQTYTLMLNDEVYAANIALPDTWDVSGIVGTWLISPGNANTTTFYDSLSITQSIPEPSTLALVGLAGMMAAVVKTRRRSGR